jgi:23S rRNA pseudouridine1911/1915/1917 synthase
MSVGLAGGVALLDRLIQSFPETPRGRARQWIAAGRVTVNGLVVRKPHELVKESDIVELQNRRASTLELGSGWVIHPRVTLLHLDAAVAVVNKGAGLLSVPAAEGELSALSILADFLEGRLHPRDRNASAKAVPPAWRRLTPLPVHRLDQYTSGVFCMAMNPQARHKLIEQLKAHSITREYIAFVEGRPGKPKGTWRDWLRLTRDEMRQNVVRFEGGSSKGSSKETAGRDDAIEAITHYEIAREYHLPGSEEVVTRLRLRLETGRKHQIRVQAAHAGVPLIGDRAYNPRYRAGSEPDIAFSRQALHAELLELDHPDTRKKMQWKAAWPKDLRELESLLARLRGNPKAENRSPKETRNPNSEKETHEAEGD